MAELTPVSEDAALGTGLQADDSAAIAALYDKYRHPIHEFAARVLGDRTRAEDIVQLTFLRAMERSASLHNADRVRAWLYGIALNLVRDELTKDRERRNAELPDTMPAAEPDPETRVVQHGDEELVWAAVASLEPEQRMALELSLRHGLSNRDLATALGVTPATATLRSHRSRSSFKSALRSLLVARSRTHCPGLAAMVPPGIQQLSPWLRRSVDHHMRRCDVCRARAALLASPLELLGGIAFLPLPASLAHDWVKRAQPTPPAQLTAGRLRWGSWRSPAVVATTLATLLFMGGGLGGALILHNRRPATAIRPPHRPPSIAPSPDAVPTPSDTPIPPTPTPTPLPTDTPSPTAAQTWADAQALMRNARGYHVTYNSDYVYPAGGAVGNPVSFDLQAQPNGDFQGSYTAIDGFIGQFNIRRASGTLAVQHINTAGNFGAANAPPDALQFFNVTYDQVSNLGDNWLPLTAEAQRPAANILTGALANYVSATTAASTVLTPPPGTLDVDAGLDPGSTQIIGRTKTVTFRASPDPFVDLSVSAFEVRFDNLAG